MGLDVTCARTERRDRGASSPSRRPRCGRRVAWAVIPSATGVLHTCVDPATGALRAVEEPGDCGGARRTSRSAARPRGRVQRHRRCRARHHGVASPPSTCPPASTSCTARRTSSTARTTRPACSCRAASAFSGRRRCSIRRGSTCRPDNGYVNISRTTVALQTAAAPPRARQRCSCTARRSRGDSLTKPSVRRGTGSSLRSRSTASTRRSR